MRSLQACLSAIDATSPTADHSTQPGAVDRTHRCPHPARGRVEAHVAQTLALREVEMKPLVAPEARSIEGFVWLPRGRIDNATAPAVLDEESGRAVRVERSHEIIGVPAERVGDAPVVDAGQVVALPYIVQARELDHQMMKALPARSDHREAVVPAVDVKEVEFVRRQAVVGDLEAETVAIERQQRLNVAHVEDHVSHAERTGQEARDR